VLVRRWFTGTPASALTIAARRTIRFFPVTGWPGSPPGIARLFRHEFIILASRSLDKEFENGSYQEV